MRILLIGYGKMGKAIEEIALQKGHTIAGIIDLENQDDISRYNKSNCEVAIEFTGPESAPGNLKSCFDNGIPVVCGSTGWLNHWEEISKKCLDTHGGFLYASNYSIGVNIFFEINRRLAAMMTDYPMYDVQMTEIHHTAKLDAPSGTAITLAEGILENIQRKEKWVCTQW